jgi:hypothetical protein
LAPNKSDVGIPCQRRSFEDFLLLEAASRAQSTVLEGATGDPCDFGFDFFFVFCFGLDLDFLPPSYVSSLSEKMDGSDVSSILLT